MIINGKEIKLMLWDTSGRPDQKENVLDLMTKIEKNAVMVMYDVCNSESYETAK